MSERKKRGNSHYVLCKCTCGLKRWILIYSLLREKSYECRSCIITKRNLKHGQNQHGQITYEYRLWLRLNFEKLLDGDWARSFETFYKDVGKKPNKQFILLRKNTQYLHNLNNSFWGHPKEKRYKNIQGQKFNDWTVKEKNYDLKGIKWLCICKCGKKDYIEQSFIVGGKSKRCRSCAAPKHKFKPGISKTVEYNSYKNMLDRCFNKEHKSYHYYGGRGITVCDSWKESFDNFIKDMGLKPTKRHSLDRIDNNGNYCKENCRWITQSEQCKNKRSVAKMQIYIQQLEDRIRNMEKTIQEYALRIEIIYDN